MERPRSLGASAAPRQQKSIVDREVLDDATAAGQEVRCSSFDPTFTTDPMPWTPYVTDEGVFYPKRGARAVLVYPVDGPPVIVAWWPMADSVPDVLFP
jgi:hypothetical protein